MGTKWYFFFRNALFIPLTRCYLRPRVVGADNIPETGGYLLAANHLSASETYMVPSVIKRQITFPAKIELFQGNSGFWSKVVAWFMRATGQIALDRAGGRQSADAMKPVVEALRAGRLVGIFPEGTRSVDGRLYKGHTGVARMLLEADVPVIPVGMIDTQFVKGRFGLPRLRRAQIVIGTPVSFSEFVGQRHQLSTLRWVTSSIMAEIQKLTGQEYVDLYGSRVKSGELSEAEIAARVRATPLEGVTKPEIRNP